MSGQVSLALPAKLAGIWQPRRYKVMHGGRGGGKSWAAAAALLLMATQRPLRVLCAREIQKSIKDSVHRLLSDQIARLQLGGFFEVQETQIKGANGSLFVFSGLQTHTVDSIKSFEGCDIVWVEEAHSVSKKSWDVLIPTIRREGSEIWLTLNPDMETDETWMRFCAVDSPDVWRCEINWRDNPFFPSVLELERQKAQRTMRPDDYANIWEGKPRKVTQGAIYRHEMERLFMDGRARDVPYDPLLPVHAVWDLGWNDAMAICMVQCGPHDVRVIDYIEDSHRTLDWYVAELQKRPYRWGRDCLPHDGKSRSYQTGKSTVEMLREMGRDAVALETAQPLEEGIRLTRMLFPKLYVDQQRCARLLECLKRYQRKLHAQTQEAMQPLHDEFSHGADALRYVAVWMPVLAQAEQVGYEEPPAPDWRT